jgi:predicted Zn-dependent peptidase
VRLVEYRRLPIVAMNLMVPAGGALDPASRSGLASLTAAMLTEGTRTRSATAISDEAGFLGASVGAGAGADGAGVSGEVLARHLPRFLDLYADVVMNPAFPSKDFERVQDQRLVALLQQRDQPQAIAGRAFAGTFWGEHPYGHVMLGTEASVKAMRPKDLAAFHARHYRPGNAELVVVGAVSEAELRPLLEKTIGRWKAGAKDVGPARRPAASPLRTILVRKPGAPQTFLLFGLPGYERAAPDLVPGSVLFQVLGGGLSSRLFRNLREEKGWTYGFGARGDARKLAGASVLAGSVKVDVTGATVKEVLNELRRLREEPITDAELAAILATCAVSVFGHLVSSLGAVHSEMTCRRGIRPIKEGTGPVSHQDFLARVPIFSNCTPEEISAIEGVAQEAAFEPGQIIVTQGTPGQAFYLIVSGRVEILRDGVSLGAFGPGDFFGEMSLLDMAPRSATIRAIEQTSCLMLASWDFKALLERQPSIAIKLLEVLSRRLRAADERLGR